MDLTKLCALGERRGWRVGVTVFIVAATVLIVVLGTVRAVGGSSEFRSFREIVQVSVVEDLNHYEYIPHVRAYPPFFAIFWAPFGLLPVGLSARMVEEGHFSAWCLAQLAGSAAAALGLMAAMTLWASRCVAAACRPDEEAVPTSRGASTLLWLLCAGLMLNSVVRTETDMFVVMMVAAAMWLLVRSDRPIAAGVLLGIATALKLTPGLFGVYLLCRRSWRGLIGMAVGGLCCTVIVPVLVWGPSGAYERHRSWTEVVLVPYGKAGPESIIERAYRKTNQSLTAAVTRYLTPYNAGTSRHPSYVNLADLPQSTVSTIGKMLKLGILAALVAAWALPPPGCSRELEAVLFGLVPLGMLLISDVSIGGHLAVVLVPVGALMAVNMRRRGRGVGRLAGSGLLGGCLLCLLIAVGPLKELSVGTAGVIVLYVISLRVACRLWHEPKPAAPAECENGS